VYGDTEVMLADSHNAMEHLLIADGLFRSNDFRARRRYINLVDHAKQKGVQVHVFSDLHPSGQKLKEITGRSSLMIGIAGILKFALDPALLDICHAETVEPTLEEEEESQTESENGGMNDIVDDDQFDTYISPADGEGEDI
jgi:protein pelota